MTDTATVGLLFSDIEGSTRLLQQLGPAYPAVLLEHQELLRTAFAAHNGEEQGTEGDSFFVTFPDAAGAVAAALAGQRALTAHAWPPDGVVRVRMGVHAGEIRSVAGSLIGLAIHEAARIGAAAHGGQVLVSAVAAELSGQLPEPGAWRDLGHQRLKDVGEIQLLQLVHADLPVDFPPPRSQGSSRNNLPAQASAFIGRNREVAEIGELLGSSRLVTVTGAGGVGKSRVALRAAAEQGARFPDGMWFVDLAPVSDDHGVAQQVAAALGLPDSVAADLGAAIESRCLLLVVDNCEHLIAAVCDVVGDLLRRCPNVSVIATSREPLGAQGEVTWRLPSLDEQDAAALFSTRARAVNSRFEVTDDNRDAVMEVCRRLDAMPLALELAAGRLGSLSVEQLAGRLDQRFRLLAGGARSASARQRTLQATVDWSYDLLEPSEQSTLRRLGTFVGGFTLEAAEAVCPSEAVEPDDVLDLVDHLVAKSLVVAEERDGAVRYRLLETIRQYALDGLVRADEVGAARDAHLDWAERLSAGAEPGVWFGVDQTAWLRRLDDEHDNLRAASDWALERRHVDKAMLMFWQVHPWLTARGRSLEGVEWCRRLLAAGGSDENRALITYSECLLEVGFHAAVSPEWIERLERDVPLLAQSQRAWIAPSAEANLARLKIVEGDADSVARAIAAGRRAVDATRGSKVTAQGMSLQALARAYVAAGDLDTARGLVEEALALVTAAGQNNGISRGSSALANIALMSGDLDTAWRHAERSIEAARRTGDNLIVIDGTTALANIAMRRGELHVARDLWTSILDDVAEQMIGHAGNQQLAMVHNGISRCAVLTGEAHDADTHATRALELVSESSPLAAEMFRTAGEAARAVGDLRRAWDLHLRAGHARPSPVTLTHVVDGLAGVRFDLGDTENAVLLLGSAAAHRPNIDQRLDGEKQAIEAITGRARAALGESAFEEYWNNGAALDLDAALATAEKMPPA